MKKDMKMASFLALVGTGLAILGVTVHTLLILLSALNFWFRFQLPWGIIQLIAFAMWVVTLVGLALIGMFFFAFWRNQ